MRISVKKHLSNEVRRVAGVKHIREVLGKAKMIWARDKESSPPYL